MKLRHIVPDSAIIPALQSSDRDEVVNELVDSLISAGAAAAALRDELVRRVLERESRGSTGFGRGVAVPHVKHDDITEIVAAVGLSEPGVDFNSLDKQPVHSVFLLLSPAQKPEEHLQAMEIIFKNLSQDTFRRFLRQASTVEEVQQLLDEADQQKFV
jgi:mannitol/fructose-specific phosphotransferase system IIA component (Ntr-type)